MVELIQFHKRLHESYDSLPSPRVFLISSHCQETPDIITARMVLFLSYRSNKDCSTRKLGNKLDLMKEVYTLSILNMFFTFGWEPNVKTKEKWRSFGPMHRHILRSCRVSRRLPTKSRLSIKVMKVRISWVCGVFRKFLRSIKTLTMIVCLPNRSQLLRQVIFGSTTRENNNK